MKKKKNLKKKKKKKTHTNRRIICFSWVLELLDKIKEKMQEDFFVVAAVNGYFLPWVFWFKSWFSS